MLLVIMHHVHPHTCFILCIHWEQPNVEDGDRTSLPGIHIFLSCAVMKFEIYNIAEDITLKFYDCVHT